MQALVTGRDGRPRCGWVELAPEFVTYHDDEWGFPVGDDTTLFEKLCLESFQTGLSWRTIYNKRENFRTAFHGFDLDAVAGFGEADVTRLLSDAGIVRNAAKIHAVINNAQRALELQASAGSLAAFLWRYEPTVPVSPPPPLRSSCPESVTLAKDLRRHGFKLVGPVTAYALMQAMGMVNDHSEGCFIRAQAESARREFRRPDAECSRPSNLSALNL